MLWRGLVNRILVGRGLASPRLVERVAGFPLARAEQCRCARIMLLVAKLVQKKRFYFLGGPLQAKMSDLESSCSFLSDLKKLLFFCLVLGPNSVHPVERKAYRYSLEVRAAS